MAKKPDALPHCFNIDKAAAAKLEEVFRLPEHLDPEGSDRKQPPSRRRQGAIELAAGGAVERSDEQHGFSPRLPEYSVDAELMDAVGPQLRQLVAGS